MGTPPSGTPADVAVSALESPSTDVVPLRVLKAFRYLEVSPVLRGVLERLTLACIATPILLLRHAKVGACPRCLP